MAASFDNPDWVDVTLHSYQSRWDEAEPDPTSKWLDDKVKATGTLSRPAIYFQGELDGVNPPLTSRKVGETFTGPFERIVLPGVGHFPTRQAPEKVAARLVQHFSPEIWTIPVPAIFPPPHQRLAKWILSRKRR